MHSLPIMGAFDASFETTTWRHWMVVCKFALNWTQLFWAAEITVVLGGSKRFWSDIQKPRQMENAARDIQDVPGGMDKTSGVCSLCW